MVERSPRTGLPIIPKAPPVRSGRCTEPPPASLVQGIDLFNGGHYWHCHEVLEAIWRFEPDPIRSLYQGILLVGVAYLHLERGNRRGAIAKFQQGLERLAPFRPTCMTVDVEALVAAASAALAALQATPAGPVPALLPPTIRLG